MSRLCLEMFAHEITIQAKRAHPFTVTMPYQTYKEISRIDAPIQEWFDENVGDPSNLQIVGWEGGEWFVFIGSSGELHFHFKEMHTAAMFKLRWL